MQLKNVVSRAISILGLENEISVTTPSAGLTKLVDCANMILQELTLQYVNLKSKENIQFEGGRAYYSDFSNGIREIIDVRVNDRRVPFVPSELYVEAPMADGSAEVTYIYYLKELGLNDTICLPPKYTEYILAIGIVCEYYYRMGLTEEAAFYKGRYEVAIGNLSAIFKPIRMPARRAL